MIIKTDSIYRELAGKMDGCQILNERLQRKVCWRIYDKWIHKLDYRRYKALLYKGAQPSSKEERRFIQLENSYIALLKTEITVTDFLNNINEKILSLTLPLGKSLEETLAYVFKEICADQATLPNPHAYALLAINGLLVDLGLFPIAYRRFHLNTFDSDNVSSFLMTCLKNTLLFQTDFINNLSPLTEDELVQKLTLLFNSSSWSTINKAFLFGSFANHEELIDSDIDLALFFNEDLSEEDKNKTYERLRKAIEEQIGRKSDMVELLCVDEGYVRSRLGNYKEVL